MTNAFRILILGLAATAVVGCSGANNASNPARSTDEELFQRAEKSLSVRNYAGAVESLSILEARFPFSPRAREAQLRMIYAFYKGGRKEEAIDAANQFIRENPRHPQVDYAYYMKGLIYFDYQPGPVEKLFRADTDKRPSENLQRSYDYFKQLLDRFPDSEYADDATQRLVFLNNRLALYEMHVADYYMEREAYIAAVNRARYIVTNHPDSESIPDALLLIVSAYERMDLPELAADTQRILDENFPGYQRQTKRRRAKKNKSG